MNVFTDAAVNHLKTLGWDSTADRWLDRLQESPKIVRGLLLSAGLPGDLRATDLTKPQLDRLRDVARQLYAQCCWAHYGLSTFVLTEGLAAKLLLTEYDKEIPDLPFNSFMINYPPEIIGSGSNRALITRIQDRESEGSLMIYEMRPDLEVYGWASRWPNGLWDPDHRHKGPRHEALLKLVLGLSAWVNAKIEPQLADNERAIIQGRRFNKVVAPIYTLGRTVKLNRELRSAAKSVASGDGSVLWKLQNRYVVRGHFRWQPIGTQLKQGEEGPVNAKKIWIEPHWKGPEGAEAWQHIYEVGAESTA